jgi:hypothetical protein
VFGTGTSVNAGGGGGGYWGGGVSTGNNPGGGGGSSWVSEDAAAVFHTQGYRTGDGRVLITVPLSASAAGLAAAAGDQQVALSWSESATSNLLGYSILGGTTPNPTTIIATVDNTVSSYLHQGPSVAVTNRALTANVVTLTTSSAHGFSVGQSVKVSDIGSPFNGTFVITAVPTTTTLTYAKTNANIASATTIGTATVASGLTNGTTYYYRVAPILLLSDVRTTASYSSVVSATPTTLTAGTYAYSGAPTLFTVPTGVSWLQVDAQAGQGGTAGSNGYVGGQGGRTQATIPVTAGEKLYLYIGGAGGRAGSSPSANTYAAGWNGGGTGNNTNAGGGGGASDIRRNEFTVTNKALTSNVATLTTSAAHGFAVGASASVADIDATFNGTYVVTSVPTTTTFTFAKTAANVASAAVSGTVRGPSVWSNATSIASRAIIAGGGGGAGYWAGGGLGGGLIGGSSTYSGSTSYGGTQTTGYALGTGKSVFGTGASSNAGGGGGGYWGGGVSTGNNVGGGGGSNWASDDSAAVVHTQGYRTGDGQMILS